jgi:hypothetical protein
VSKNNYFSYMILLVFLKKKKTLLKATAKMKEIQPVGKHICIFNTFVSLHTSYITILNYKGIKHLPKQERDFPNRRKLFS